MVSGVGRNNASSLSRPSCRLLGLSLRAGGVSDAQADGSRTTYGLLNYTSISKQPDA